MRALTNTLRAGRRLIVHCRQALWLNSRLGYPIGDAWRRAGMWAM